MSDIVRIKLHVGTGFASCAHEDTIEVDKEYWNEMSEEEQEKFMDEAAVDFRNNVIECSAWVLDEENE